MEATVLVAEDRQDLSDLIKLYLEKEGFTVVMARDGEEALEMFNTHKPDLCLLDIMMPKVNGLAVLQEVRKSSTVPVIFLTAKVTEGDKILGLDLGADDYITKPFSYLELVSRVKAHLRRKYKYDKSNHTKVFKDLVIDMKSCCILRQGVNCEFTATEYRIFMKLLSNPHRVFTRRQLYEEIYGNVMDGDENTVSVHISRLRDKLNKDNKENLSYITTVRGFGYKIDQE